MRKIFRMSKTELGKIFMRPSMYILTAVLVVALIVSFMFFKPESENKKYTYDLNNTEAIHLKFLSEDLEVPLKNAKVDIDNYIVSLTAENNTYDKFWEHFSSLNGYFETNLDDVVENAIRDNVFDATEKSNCVGVFNDLKAKTNIVLDYMTYNIKNKEINFFMTTQFYEKLDKTLKNFRDNLPSSEDVSNFDAKQLYERRNLLKENYDLRSLELQIKDLERVEIEEESLTELLDNYYYLNFDKTTGNRIFKLKELYDAVSEYYYEPEHIQSTDEQIIYELNERIAMYYDYLQMCKNLLSSNFELLIIGDKTDDQIANYIGFSGISKYNLTQSVTTSKYFFDTLTDEDEANDTFGYEYLTGFNFMQNSGAETNAYDFAFYAMQILSAFIMIFVIFYATSLLSGEQSSGTLKMVATRPYTRNKIYSGKFLACLNVALILMTISLFASLAIGFAMYGFSFQSVLLVINAKTVIITNPIVVLLMYMASLLIDTVFYVSLAIFVSMIFKHATIATTISNAIFLASTYLAGSITASWIRFIPSLNTGIFKFFTTSATGLFSFSIVPNVNLLYSGIILAVTTIAFDILGRYMFTHRSLDK
ncbi:MAG: hypothetical protein E7378_01135 [Clostridiales bacterium]|nr:hypothetical protein [Clostridiales bacterium]